MIKTLTAGTSTAKASKKLGSLGITGVTAF